MIDLHCHILPEIDDGPVSLEETKAMLAIAKNEGISTIAATHHFYEEEDTVELYLKAVSDARIRTQPIIDEQELDICIIGGAEVFISPFISELKDIEKLCINNSRYLLIELPMADIPQYTEDVVYQLNLKGIRPIIAHPERNRRIISDPNALLPLITLGALAQANTGSITGLFGKQVQKSAKKLIKHNMIHAVASDAHSPRRRGPYMREAARMVTKWVGGPIAKTILEEIPNAIVNDEYIEKSQPTRPYPGLFSRGR